MKTFVAAVLLLQVFFGQGRSDVVENHRDFAMAQIARCIEETDVNLNELVKAIQDSNTEHSAVEEFTTCFEDAMKPVESDFEQFCRETNQNGNLAQLILCYSNILIDYLKDFIA
ncbi:uncharacterized protein LOC116179650 [Photinus pyralis]|uniref:uncharacterized protein LOC116179647 n=1 Tax=Photinus pyralis TaxID=7054 RepID=UPI0012672092|nr:uncharacterized protein LOC116179647 [Photinus pyralis]XP_031355318.1 uncharacterized protein LOC116179650 [Photinus pyralis]